MGVDSQFLTVITVDVVLLGTATIVVDGAVLLGQYPLHAEAEHLGLVLCLFVDIQVLVNDELTLDVQSVSYGECCVQARK